MRRILPHMDRLSALFAGSGCKYSRGMTLLTSPAPVARVLFDESHGEAWTISADRAAALQPAHPADSSYAAAATALSTRELAVDAHRDGPLDAAALAGVDVLVIAHPSEARW